MAQITVNKDGSPLSGGEPFEFDQERLAAEKRWARQHAEYWGELQFLNEFELEEFSDFFADGWVDYCLHSSEDIDAGMKALYQTFLKERKERDNG